MAFRRLKFFLTNKKCGITPILLGAGKPEMRADNH
jgi:hypothetical protein